MRVVHKQMRRPVKYNREPRNTTINEKLAHESAGSQISGKWTNNLVDSIGEMAYYVKKNTFGHFLYHICR